MSETCRHDAVERIHESGTDYWICADCGGAEFVLVGAGFQLAAAARARSEAISECAAIVKSYQRWEPRLESGCTAAPGFAAINMEMEKAWREIRARAARLHHSNEPFTPIDYHAGEVRNLCTALLSARSSLELKEKEIGRLRRGITSLASWCETIDREDVAGTILLFRDGNIQELKP